MSEKPEIPRTNDVLPKTSWLGRHVGTVLTAIGLVVGLLTLIELSPRLSVAQEAPIDPRNLVPPFSVKNDGYLRLIDVRTACFIWKAHTEFGSAENVFGQPAYGIGTEKVLFPTQTITVETGMAFMMPASAVKDFDMGVVVYFRPWPFTFFRSRRVFRFVAHLVEDHLVWQKQPSTYMEKAIDDLLGAEGIE